VNEPVRYRVGVDIGGTFTDIVFLAPDGELHTRKVSSTVDDYAQAIVQGLNEVFADTGLAACDVQEMIHGTTVASNAILEMAGARTGLITTEGFRDVLELRTLRMPRLYDIAWEKPEPLVPRDLRVTVGERVDARGGIQRPLQQASIEEAVDALAASDVEAIAVCLINSFANPQHERQIGEVIAARAPQLAYCLSVDVLPEMREYERTSTTVINAYLLPVVARYLRSLLDELVRGAIEAPLLLMQSNGGLTTARHAMAFPCHIIESGPAGGVVGAHALAQRLGLGDVVTFDMGGTTAKASLIEGGEYSRAVDFSVGAGIMAGSRLLTGAGYRLKVPAIDLAEVGAGGGSLVWLDAGGAMQIGPRSAGADPGPVCYGRGNEQPTVTDANVVLGYLNPTQLVGGALPIDAGLSRAALEERVATPLGLELAHAAYGAHQIAASNMIRAIKAVSSERGRDPRRFTLFAFGGNGPLFAATMARALGMKEIVVPPGAGLFSSFGLLYADVEHHYSRTVSEVLRDADRDRLASAWGELEAQAREQLHREGFPDERIRVRRSGNMHYKGQIFELSVPVAEGEIEISALEQAFAAEHERTYGHRAGDDEPVELVNVEVVGQGLPDRPRVPERLRQAHAAAATAAPREAYFGPESGWLLTPVIARDELTARREGPFIIEEYDATCVVPPGARAALDDYGNVIVSLG
jgi:N-methylhydantoinase A